MDTHSGNLLKLGTKFAAKSLCANFRSCIRVSRSCMSLEASNQFWPRNMHSLRAHIGVGVKLTNHFEGQYQDFYINMLSLYVLGDVGYSPFSIFCVSSASP